MVYLAYNRNMENLAYNRNLVNIWLIIRTLYIYGL